MTLLERLGALIQALGTRDETYIALNNPVQGVGYRRVACFVGVIAMGLPLGMLLVSALSNECFYDTVSHYFYARWAGAIFVAALAFLGSFLIGYSGENALEGRLALLTGLAMIIVAIVPAGGIGCEDDFQVRQIFAHVAIEGSSVSISPVVKGEVLSHFQILWGRVGEALELLHFVAAGVVLILMAVFAFFVFTRVEPAIHLDDQTGQLRPKKRLRNLIYIASGFLVLCCIVVLFCSSLPSPESDRAIQWNLYNLSFWFETVAFFAFGFSWLLRGRFFGDWLVDDHEAEMVRGAHYC